MAPVISFSTNLSADVNSTPALSIRCATISGVHCASFWVSSSSLVKRNGPAPALLHR